MRYNSLSVDALPARVMISAIPTRIGTLCTKFLTGGFWLYSTVFSRLARPYIMYCPYPHDDMDTVSFVLMATLTKVVSAVSGRSI